MTSTTAPWLTSLSALHGTSGAPSTDTSPAPTPLASTTGPLFTTNLRGLLGESPRDDSVVVVEGAAHEAAAQTKRTTRARLPRTWVTALLGVLAVVMLVGAGLLVRTALSPDQDVTAPVPSEEFAAPAGEPVAGVLGVDAPVEVPNDDDDNDAAKKTPTVPMTVDRMAPSRMFIPSLSVYMPIESDQTFVESHYEGFETLRIPTNPRHGVWYSGGAGLSGGDQGTTLVASHVSTKSGWGALRYLYKLKGNEIVYTTDAAGVAQAWQVSQMRVEDHLDFPQEYWSATGVRELVIATCGGRHLGNGIFAQNVFAIAVPVAMPVVTPAA